MYFILLLFCGSRKSFLTLQQPILYKYSRSIQEEIQTAEELQICHKTVLTKSKYPVGQVEIDLIMRKSWQFDQQNGDQQYF